MTSTIAPNQSSHFDLPPSAPAAARAVFRLMKRLRHGTLDVFMPDGSSARFGQPGDGELRAVLNLRNWNVCAQP